MDNYTIKITITIYNNYKFNRKYSLGMGSQCLQMHGINLSLLLREDLWIVIYCTQIHK